ncbi:MAG TPA: ubiquinone/menaquinone biosynthesis methyltransferase [Gemmatimonadaceae bacterium]|jgi:demethylmenaquinone methyltransferase/2-methoxy-6-polyprenyl-1,4-benzoquinol methylase
MTVLDAERATADAAATGAAVKRGYVKQMFSDIAPHYDRVNRIISFRLDQWWRGKAIRELNIGHDPAATYLDLCAGTLDIASQIAARKDFRGTVVAADFAEPMLRAGLKKVSPAVVRPVTADALDLPFTNDFAAGAIVVFGIRNVVDLNAALREVHRVLRPGARFVILEFGATQNPLVGWIYRLYFNHLCPLIGNAVARHHSAYNYLPKSVAHFPTEPDLAQRMRDAGFDNVRWRSYTFGVVAIHVGEKHS